MPTLQVLFFLSFALGTFAVICQSPLSPERCSLIRLNCLQFTADECVGSGGEYMEGRGACGYCNLCAKYVGENAKCNETNSNSIVTSICRPPLTCTGNSGTCVKNCECNN